MPTTTIRLPEALKDRIAHAAERAGTTSHAFILLDHLYQHEVADAPSRIAEILEAISVLEHNPLIGQPARTDLRELIIGRQSRGHVALYRYVPEIDSVFVLAIPSQREAGYKRS